MCLIIFVVVYTVEFQKRGLPHSHMCIFLDPADKLKTAEHIDEIITAENPDQKEDPHLYKLVSEFMIHGPCGLDNPRCPCMVNGKCTKNFPKDFRDETSIDSDGFPLYRRREDGNSVLKGKTYLDNRYVVPYNKRLLRRFEAHINVEWCNQAASIKYLFKYINKGADRVTVKFYSGNSDKNGDDDNNVDEIKEYYNCSACEATWRIFSFYIHYRYPAVERLPFHLPDQQQVMYDANNTIDEVLDDPSVASSKFLSWIETNKIYEYARQFTYCEFPRHFVWKAKDKKWYPRINGKTVGRIHHVPPSTCEAYFLRVLLNIIKGPTCFEDIRTVNGELFPFFRDACYALGLLDDDKEYIECIQEASFWGTGHYLRSLFAMLLISNSVSRPDNLWDKTWTFMADDIIYRTRIAHQNPGMFFFVLFTICTYLL